MRKIFLVMLLFLILLFSCDVNHSNKNETHAESDNQDSSQENKFFKDYAKDSYIIAETSGIKLLFSEDSTTTYIRYSSSKVDTTIGKLRLSGALGQPPAVNIDSLDTNKFVIILTVYRYYIETGEAYVYVYSFNKSNLEFFEVCYVENLGSHSIDLGYKEDVSFYDYFINKKEKKIYFKEYKPYKSIKENNVYRTITKAECYIK